MNFFKPADFDGIEQSKYIPLIAHEGKIRVAARANHLLRERGVRVYMHESNATDPRRNWIFDEIQQNYHTYCAYVIGIEEIEKKCEKHEPSDNCFMHTDGTEGVGFCRHCHKKIKATWQVVSEGEG